MFDLLKEVDQTYGKLHDGLSDMIEEGRLTEGMIPDDYRFLVETLAKCNEVDAKIQRAIKEVK